MATDDNANKAAAVLSEIGEWQRIMSLDYERVLDVYIDAKSPHAYLSIRPSLEVARDYRVRVNFLPYTLSYGALGLTTRVDADMTRRPADASADRKARMYYAAARQYAALQALPFRSPYRLLDSELAHRAFLFAKAQGLEVPFIMQVYVAGWGSGWRDFELESIDSLRHMLTEVGASVEGFDEFVAPGGPGQDALAECIEAAEASGVTGVPHYVFFDAGLEREVGLFGREHLALIRGKYSAEGLARTADVRPDFSHAWAGPQPAQP